VVEEEFTAFGVQKNGFHFINDFSTAAIIDEMRLHHAISRDLLELYEKLVPDSGLCSGMCFAALDRYYKIEPPPEDTTAPNSGDLFEELVRRNHNALKWGATIAKTLLYQIAFDTGKGNIDELTIGYKTQIDEWPKIKKKIKDGIPAPMVLITSSNPIKVTKNHAVLAIGYKVEGDKVKIYAYDPNYDKRVRISFILGATHHDISIKRSKGGYLNGFFYNSYDRTEHKITKKEVEEMQLHRSTNLSWFWMLFNSN